MNKELLISLYEIHSPSYGEDKMRKFIKKYARSIGISSLYCDHGNLYITKGNADTYPCIVAHMDQVQKLHRNFKTFISGDIIFGYNAYNGELGKEQLLDSLIKDDIEREGLGADDKNGIWVALECLRKYDNIKVAFFMGEEIGCVGSGKADMKFFKDVRFVIQCDRRNGGDFIYDVYGQMCSDEFMQDSHYQDFGYKLCEGLSTDAAELYTKGVGVSCVNLSCGYYNPHTDKEYTILSELEHCLEFVMYIVDNCTKVYKHEYTEQVSYYSGRSFRSGYDWFGEPYSVDYNEYYEMDFDVMDDILQSDPNLEFETIARDYKSMFLTSDVDLLRNIYDDVVAYYDYSDHNSEIVFGDDKKAS